MSTTPNIKDCPCCGSPGLLIALPGSSDYTVICSSDQIPVVQPSSPCAPSTMKCLLSSRDNFAFHYLLVFNAIRAWNSYTESMTANRERLAKENQGTEKSPTTSTPPTPPTPPHTPVTK